MEALDLCLACKGCTSECPVNVDMPTLKSEFLAHYYEHRRRPRSAYAFGFVDRWLRLASHAPRLANLFTQTPGTAGLAKRVAGVSPRRPLPRIAATPFRRWFRGHAAPAGGPQVVLWPDTFSNYFAPQIAVAAVEVLERAGLRVAIPRRHLCCGRPLYDYGFLDQARRYGSRVLDELREPIRAGVPFVGLEPSCVAVFRDDLPKLLPHEEDAKRLAGQFFHLAEFLADHVDGYVPPALDRRVLVHGHCHAHATHGVDPERTLLERTGAEVEILDSGCCGMAGAWGYEEAHYDVSVACAERVLLPALRAASADTIVLADGFSCRSQIEQTGTGRHALHLAEVLRLASG
jgi:Fe-S oxidoreductase